MASHYKSKRSALIGDVIRVIYGRQDPNERLCDLESAYGRFREDDPLLQEIHDHAHPQRCGGGRRVLRKHLPE